MAAGEGGVVMEFNLFTLRRKLEIEKWREYTWEEVARSAGVHPNTVYNLAANRSKRVDVETLGKLDNYFIGEGLDIGPGDLFVFKPAEPAQS